MTAPPAEPRAPYARRDVGWVLAAQALLLLVLLPFYGPHRDELYFAAAGRHLAWGYPDQPSLVPFLARISGEVAPHSIVALRVPAVLAALALTAIGAELSRLLGGARRAQVLTALVVAFSAVVMVNGHRLSTAGLDEVAWAGILVVVAHAVLNDRPRLWLLAGLLAGIGLNDKHSVAFLIGGLLIAMALDPATRPVLRSAWPWLGGLLALVMWLPNLAWQASHDWPVFALTHSIADEYGGVAGRVGLVLQAAIMFSPLICVVWVIGLVGLLRDPAWRRHRFLGLIFVVLLAFFLVATGKGYYLAGAIVPLIAAGCTRLAARDWTVRRLTVVGTVLVVSSAVAWPALVPVLPTRVYADSFYPAIDSDQPETVGWPAYVDRVRAVVDALPADQRDNAVLYTENYGEAGAAQWYGVGVPVYSGHNGWRSWGPPPASAAPVVVWGYDDPAVDFTGCRWAATLHNAYGLDNDEEGSQVWVCAAPRGGWAARWPVMAHYDA